MEKNTCFLLVTKNEALELNRLHGRCSSINAFDSARWYNGMSHIIGKATSDEISRRGQEAFEKGDKYNVHIVVDRIADSIGDSARLHDVDPGPSTDEHIRQELQKPLIDEATMEQIKKDLGR